MDKQAFYNDPLYRNVLQAKNKFEANQALHVLIAIRGIEAKNNLIRLLQGEKNEKHIR